MMLHATGTGRHAQLKATHSALSMESMCAWQYTTRAHVGMEHELTWIVETEVSMRGCSTRLLAAAFMHAGAAAF